MKRVGLILLLILPLIAGCSRKGNEALPVRTGDLQVQFKIQDLAERCDLPATFPVIATLYSDTAGAVPVRADTVLAQVDARETIEFQKLAPQFFYLHLRVDASCAVPEGCPNNTVVYVRLDQITTTKLITVDVYDTLIWCWEE